jgi:uncharacterized protein
MRYTWHEAKRQKNLNKRGLDFAEAEKVFTGPTFTFEDDRKDYGEQRWVTLGLSGDKVLVIVHTETENEIRIISMRKRQIKMNNYYSSEISDDHDDYPEVIQDDLDRAVFRIGLKSAPSHKQQVTILLDTVLIEYFKAKAGQSDYQRLINDTLHRAIEHEISENTLHRVVCNS